MSNLQCCFAARSCGGWQAFARYGSSMSDAEQPVWDQSFREIGLVALQAAVLARRIFTPPARRGDLVPEQRQMLMALALIDSAPYEHPTASVDGLAVQLTLDAEHVRELVFDLLTAGYILVADEQEDDPAQFHLSARGWAAAAEAIERAGRFLPGWPPVTAAEESA
jgi:hypothetical protein